MKATKTKKFYINFIDGKMLLCAENKKLEITEIEGSVTEITEKMSPYGQEQIEIIIKNEQIEYHIVGYKQNNAIIALINFLSTAENLTKIKITSYEKQAKNLNKIRTYVNVFEYCEATGNWDKLSWQVHKPSIPGILKSENKVQNSYDGINYKQTDDVQFQRLFTAQIQRLKKKLSK